jgi:hypothetical protein
MANQAVRNLKGEEGGKYRTGAGTLTPSAPYTYFDCVYAHEAASVNATSANISGTLTTVAIPAGGVWYGLFSSVEVISGAVTAYNKA